MRKILQISMIFSLFLSLSPISNAQALEIVSSEETVSGSPSAQSFKAHVVVKNISDADLIVWASARKVELTEGHKYLFCDLNYCYQSTDGDELLADESFVLGSGEQTGAEVVYIGLEPNGISGRSIITMKFAIEGDPFDFIEFTATFDVLTSVANNPESAFSVSEAMPNPAADMITIKYNIPDINIRSRLSIYDIYGIVIKEIELDQSGRSISVDISNLVPGTYFYRLNSGSEIIGSKFVVSR